MNIPFMLEHSYRGIILWRYKIYEPGVDSGVDDLFLKIESRPAPDRLVYDEGLTQALRILDTMSNPGNDVEVFRVYVVPDEIKGWMMEIQADGDLVKRWFLSGGLRPCSESLVYTLTGMARPGFSAEMIVPPQDGELDEYVQLVRDLRLADCARDWAPTSALEKAWSSTIQKIQDAL